MASGSPGILQRDFNTLFESGSLTGLTDRDLVERVSGAPSTAAKAAFEALVNRHGPMVLRVCRNVLGCLDDAEDAFQATFLVLLKQQRSIRKLDSVASWLYGVAARVAARARVDGARRRKSEQGGIKLVAVSAETVDPADDLDQAVHGPIVQEEVRRLPEKYRSVVLLCYWEGLTQEQAAHQLGCPIGTVRSRIARARDLLRRRLVRRGLSASAGALAVFSTASAPAAIPLASLPLDLVRSSVQAAMCVAAGQSTAGIVPASVLLLVRRVLWSFAMMKMTKLAAVSAVTILLAFGARSWAQRPHREDREPARAVTKEKSKDSPTARAHLEHVIEPPDLLLVQVLEALPGRPISGERLVHPDGKISLGFYGDVYVAGLTVPQAKERIVRHMQKYLTDDVLGLQDVDPATGKPNTDAEGMLKRFNPKESDRILVEVAKNNSTFCYVLGDLAVPGRLPFTGSEHVLDVIHKCGGLLPSADRTKIKLMRGFPKGSPIQVLPVDYEEISMGTISATNYDLLPNDRIVVPRDPGKSGTVDSDQSSPSPTTKPITSDEAQPKTHFERRPETRSTDPFHLPDEVERRLNQMEKKLDAILEKLDEQKKP